MLRDGKRYSHILDARTGWPVRDAPHSITVAADTCTQAGSLATLALLEGRDARAFLHEQNVKFWLQECEDAPRPLVRTANSGCSIGGD